MYFDTTEWSKVGQGLNIKHPKEFTDFSSSDFTFSHDKL